MAKWENIIEYLYECKDVIGKMNVSDISKIINILRELQKSDGRLFILGVGGSAANSSHAVNDFRKIAGIESYAPTDNVSELTARINDEGWESSYANWLKVSKLSDKDCIMILSVGGGDLEKRVSVNLAMSIDLAYSVGAKVVGIVGRDGGFTARHSDACVIIPIVNINNITPHTESFQSVLLHLIAMELRK